MGLEGTSDPHFPDLSAQMPGTGGLEFPDLCAPSFPKFPS